MRMSELFRRNVFQATVGGLITRSKINRRHTVYFSDIFVNYIKTCEESGYSKEMKEIGRKWMLLYFGKLVPQTIKMLPMFILNNLMRKIWIAIGLMKDFRIRKSNSIIEITTKSEAITKVIGKNYFSVGLFIGICNALFKSEVEIIDVSQTKESSRYIFRIIHKPLVAVKSKSRETYEKLNSLPTAKGFALDDALRKNILQLRDGNRLFFRGKPVNLVENTIFHLIGNKNIMLDTLPGISYDFFREIIKDSTPDEKLRSIKTILQIMGWGSVNIVLRGKETVFDIRNPPYGIQKEKDNWNFLANSLLGYMWLLDKNIRIKSIREHDKHIRIIYG